MILITGANGQLGSAAKDAFMKRNCAVEALSRSELDITDAEALHRYAAGRKIDCIVNCAAYTAVDAAESHPQEAFAANAYAPWRLAMLGAPILHVSTDYVFDGMSETPYETDALAKPLSVYGLSKRAGELALLEGGFKGAIVRTAWVYSKHEGTRNFYHTMRRLQRERSELGVVADQVGTPTRAEDLAEALAMLYEANAHLEPMHLLHFTNAGRCSWFDFAQAILENSGESCTLRPITTEEYPTAAARPKMSVLSLASLERYGIKPREWRDALESE